MVFFYGEGKVIFKLNDNKICVHWIDLHWNGEKVESLVSYNDLDKMSKFRICAESYKGIRRKRL